MGADHSVRRLLLGWLLAPLAAVLVTSAITAYRTALGIASDAYDRALLDPALAIAQRLRPGEAGVELDMPAAALDALQVDAVDSMFFAVIDRGRLIAGQGGLPAPPADLSPTAPIFYDAAREGQPVRVAAMAVPFPDGPVTVQVAETLLKRERLVQQVLLANAVTGIAFLLAAFAVVWFGVARGLAPLDKLRAELAARSHRDLRAVPEDHAPEEVRPLVHELNDLLGRLAKAIEAQQRFVADAAHQLRTPLAALQAQVEAARRDPLPPELEPTVEQLHAATRRAAHLARQLLTLASVDPSAERPFTPQPVGLADIAQTNIADWIARADHKQIDLGFELEPAPVRGEPALLAELVANLLDNALNYTPAGGEVTVRTGRRDGQSFLEVENGGPGIPEAEREHVFERFHRVRGTPGEGTGLGLAIVREIGHRHGAAVALRTPRARAGTLIEVIFPAPAD